MRTETLTGLLPPVGCADVATRQAIEQLNRLMDERFERARAGWRGDLGHRRRQQLLTFLSANAVVLGIVVAVVPLLRRPELSGASGGGGRDRGSGHPRGEP